MRICWGATHAIVGGGKPHHFKYFCRYAPFCPPRRQPPTAAAYQVACLHRCQSHSRIARLSCVLCCLVTAAPFSSAIPLPTVVTNRPCSRVQAGQRGLGAIRGFLLHCQRPQILEPRRSLRSESAARFSGGNHGRTQGGNHGCHPGERPQGLLWRGYEATAGELQGQQRTDRKANVRGSSRPKGSSTYGGVNVSSGGSGCWEVGWQWRSFALPPHICRTVCALHRLQPPKPGPRRPPKRWPSC